MGYDFAANIAARLVSSVNTMRHARGFSSRYFLTLFFDSFTSMASTTRPFGANSLSMSSTISCSPRQYWHHVAQNCSRTTFPLRESLLNFSPLSVLAENRGAGSRASEAVSVHAAARITNPTRTRSVLDRTVMADEGSTKCFQLLLWHSRRLWQFWHSGGCAA